MPPSPGNGSWDGTERRRSSPAERELYAQNKARAKRQFVLPEPKALILWQFARLPRSVLFLIALSGVLYVAWAETAWRRGVESHVETAEQGYARLAAVEALALSTASHVKGLGEEIRLLREEQKEQRLDQLAFYRWSAERAGDESRARQLGERLKELRKDDAQ